MDLNEFPPEAANLSADEYRDLSPLFCTQMFESNDEAFILDGGYPNLLMSPDLRLPSQPAHTRVPSPPATSIENAIAGFNNGAWDPIDDGNGVHDASENVVVAAVSVGAANENTDHDDGDGEVSLQFLAAISSPDEPYVGKIFESSEEARYYYNEYARNVGFSIRNATSRKSAVTGILDKVLFVCNKEGKGKQSKSEREDVTEPVPCEENNPDGIEENVEAEGAANKKTSSGAKRVREKMIYTNCRARMLVKHDGGRWIVRNFVAEHNHPLVDKPSLSKFLKSHSGIPPEEVEFLTLLHGCNLDTSRMMQLMSDLYGSAKFVPYHTKHVSNLRSSIRSHEGSSDMSEAISYFYDMQKEDPEFFFKVKLDADDKVENIFWVDGAAREAYRTYNDCISFDSTYLTNMYKMPFAPFIAINRHGLTIQVGCGFLRNETIEGYVWLFRAFLEAMNGLQPLNIITDQDLSMAAAIRVVFENARHRCCRWHIISKIEARLGNFFKTRGGMEAEYNEIVNYSLSPAEFEARWAAMIERHTAHDNEILTNLYQIRHLWVPAYFMDRFFPFLQSTQRSESFNGVLKKYVNPHNSILDFCHQYKKIQDKTDVAEEKQDYRTDQKVPPPWSRFPIEKHAIEVYTRNIYFRFRSELQKIADYVACPIFPNVYRLSPVLDFAGGYGTRPYDVMFDKERSIISCQCGKFEKDGIFCCHVLKVLTDSGLKKIPDHYILVRWTPKKDATTIGVLPGKIASMPEKSKRALRHANLAHSFAKIAQQASMSEDLTDIARTHINAMISEITALKKAKKSKKNNAETTQVNTTACAQAFDSGNAHEHLDSGNTQEAGQQEVAHEGIAQQQDPQGQNTVLVKDPDVTKTKGRTRTKRYKSALEVHVKKNSNHCKICGSTQHNAVTCSMKKQ